MNETEELGKLFEEHRGHLRSVAYRMLGSASEADDAVQEAWLKLNRSDVATINNLEGWLTTVVARVCLDVLRSRKSKREDALDELEVEPTPRRDSSNPEQEALLKDSVGLALLIMLDTLGPAERVAFVLHDVLDLSFEEIGAIVGRTPAAARQLASRARRRVRGGETLPSSELKSQRVVVNSFLSALQNGDFVGLLAVLDPDVLVRANMGPGEPTEIRGAESWAKGAIAFSRLAESVQLALVDGNVGLIFAPAGRLTRALTFKIDQGRIVEFEVIANPERLKQLTLGMIKD
jgi:RNA polymerase sigma factor (sigma-70 family)